MAPFTTPSSYQRSDFNVVLFAIGEDDRASWYMIPYVYEHTFFLYIFLLLSYIFYNFPSLLVLVIGIPEHIH